MLRCLNTTVNVTFGLTPHSRLNYGVGCVQHNETNNIAADVITPSLCQKPKMQLLRIRVFAVVAALAMISSWATFFVAMWMKMDWLLLLAFAAFFPSCAYVVLLDASRRAFPFEYSLLGPKCRTQPPSNWAPGLRVATFLAIAQFRTPAQIAVDREGMYIVTLLAGSCFIPSHAILLIRPDWFGWDAIEHRWQEVRSPIYVKSSLRPAIERALLNPGECPFGGVNEEARMK
jgi:hypothetical protein